MCLQRDCYRALGSFMLEEVQKNVSNIPQPSQSLLHKAEGVLVLFFFFQPRLICCVKRAKMQSGSFRDSL